MSYSLAKKIKTNNIIKFKHEMNFLLYTTPYKINKVDLLNYAIRKNRINIVKLLVTDYETDVTTVLNTACFYRHFNMVRFLCEHGSKPDDMSLEILVSKKKSFEIVKYIFNKYPGVNFNRDTILLHVVDTNLLTFLLQKKSKKITGNVKIFKEK